MDIKNNSGISLIILVVTIVVLLILSTIVFNIGGDIFNNTQNDTSLSELKIVKQAVLEKYTKYLAVKDESILVGEDISKIDVENIISGLGITLQSNGGYKRLVPDLLEQIGVTNAKDTYIVNYETGEVINATKIKTKNNQVLYTYGISYK
ncbi:hypothetical protein D3C72_1499380 [compost metagenome]